MPTKRASGRGQAPPGPSTSTPAAGSPLLNASLVLVAVGYGLALLVERRDLSWPPRELLASLYTMAGCLAMVGPLVLWRIGSTEGALGDLTWMTGGLIVWIFDLAALARGQLQGLAWATPLEPEVLGPVALAVMIAGWRVGRSPWSWTWTSVTGWLLGLVWVAMGLLAMLPRRPDLLVP